MARKQKSFNQRCYDALLKVPKGRVTTYAELARSLRSRAYRAVGNAMHRNPNAPKVPCHRVVRSDGSLGGYALGSGAKARMLKAEGVPILRQQIVNFEKYFFRFD